MKFRRQIVSAAILFLAGGWTVVSVPEAAQGQQDVYKRQNELQVWFLSEHLVDAPLVNAAEPRLRSAS